MASFSPPLRDMRSRVLYKAPRASELRVRVSPFEAAFSYKTARLELSQINSHIEIKKPI